MSFLALSRRRAAGFPVLFAAVVFAHALEPAAVEERMSALAREANARMDAEDWARADSVIRRMALLDPDHPKTYLQATTLLVRRGKLAGARAFLDDLGAEGTPGRIYGEGLLLTIEGKTEEARAAYSRALEDYGSRANASGEAACRWSLGNTDLNEGKLEDAEARYSQARSSFEGLGDRLGVAAATSGLARIELKRRRPDAALVFELQSLSIRQALHDRLGEERSWRSIALIWTEKGDRARVLNAYRKAVDLARSTKNLPELYAALRTQAAYEKAQEHFKEVVHLRREARRVALAYGDSGKLWEITGELGNSLLAAAEYPEAARMYEEAALLSKSSPDPAREAARSLERLGACLNRLGQYQRSREVLERALEIAVRIGDRSLEAAVRNGLGNTRLAAGEMSEALVQYEIALELHRRHEDARGEIGALNNLGAVYYEIGDLRRAREYLEIALEKAEAAKDQRAVARGRKNLGTILFDEGKGEAALEQMLVSMRLWREREDRRSTASAGAAAAEVLLHLGRSEQAAPLATEALAGAREAGDLAGEARVLNLLGEIHLARGASRDALAAHTRALLLARELHLRSQTWRAHAGLSDALEASGRPSEALAEALSGLDDLEGVRANLESDESKTRYLSGKRALYEQALDLLLPATAVASHSAVARAFEVSERAHARGLLDVLAESGARRLPLDPELKRREDLVLATLAQATTRLSEAPPGDRKAARREITEAERDLERLQIEIRRRDPVRASWVARRVLTLEEVRRGLGEDEILLSYFIGEKRAWLWVVSREETALETLGTPREIRERVAAFRREVDAPAMRLEGGEHERDAALRLAQIILPRALPASRRILVAPDGPLHQVPFDALLVGGRFLVEAHEIAVVPSASARSLMGGVARRGGPGGFLGIGAPVLPPGEGSLPSLTHAKTELEAIAAMFPGETAALLVGPAATKQALQSEELERFRYLHFATHGWLDSENPRHMGLVLSPRDGESRDLLTLDEIMARRLSADLVVLSSCGSGAGELVEGEGFVGLTRAFLYAGARSVVGSLWDVEDRPTTEMMRALYTGLQKGKTAAAALRDAKLAFITSERPELRRPHSWAPFVFVGEIAKAGR